MLSVFPLSVLKVQIGFLVIRLVESGPGPHAFSLDKRLGSVSEERLQYFFTQPRKVLSRQEIKKRERDEEKTHTLPGPRGKSESQGQRQRLFVYLC